MRKTKIAGIGYYVPERIVTNKDLEKFMDTSDEWIISRTGIQERRWVDSGIGTSDLAVKATEKALEMAKVSAKDIDLVICATLTSDYHFPGSAVQIQDKMGMDTIGAFDIKAACSAFVYGLSIGDQFVKTGQADNVLVIGAEIQSTGLDLSTKGRDMAVLFGDGAGAVVLHPSNGSSEILSTHIHSQGKHLKDLWVEVPASIESPCLTKEMIEEGRHYPQMNGREVFRNAVVRFPEVIMQALNKNNLTVDDVNMFIPHQANLRITQSVAKRLGVGMDRMYSNIERYGNTTGASIPIALAEAHHEGKIKKDDIVILAAFGSGFTWASAAIRW
ncbi:MAG: ketoacyl-ACP synthase III [Candidatus Marinimicrobia bacterium]|nr:ketoacyl-ACP synthase III [Candidatus Neomarinimicrobiota bacterium]